MFSYRTALTIPRVANTSGRCTWLYRSWNSSQRVGSVELASTRTIYFSILSSHS